VGAGAAFGYVLVTVEAQPDRRGNDFEGFAYTRVSQPRARAAALCSSALDVQARFLLLVLAEVQRNGCCPMGPEVWGPALGISTGEAESLVKHFTEVGVLTEESDLYCLHVHGRAVNKGAGRRLLCGKAAAGSPRRKARPRARAYPPLVMTGEPFRPPFARPRT
jgi:hypothetical protein